MKTNNKGRRSGFTLVELLVVVVIVAALAAVSISTTQRMMGKARANQAMQNLRQASPVISTYAVDNSMKLPAPKGPVTLTNGTVEILQWNEVCLTILYPATAIADFKTTQWWETNKCILRNPMFKDSAGWSPLSPGFAMNSKLPENIAAANGEPAPLDPLSISVSLSSISDPGRTPLIAPNTKWSYVFDPADIAQFTTTPSRDLLSDGKFPILFVDGHVETMTPKEYVERELFAFPRTAPEA